jgi:hypothetical protein
MRIYLSFRHENDDLANGSRVVVPETGPSEPADEAEVGTGMAVSPDGRGSVTAAG